jgi:two-component system CheB/CheR fusion protein
MALNQIENLNDYFTFIRRNPLETETLFKELLIGVTNFFRDKDAFESLRKNIIPNIFKDRNPDLPVRVWIPGCSTGEEAYTIAILLQEQMEIVKQSYKIQIFATDIDIEAVEKARVGIYPESILVDVRLVHLAKYFTKENNTYRIQKFIRDMVVFAKQDVLKDPPFSNLDLISCRNLLIYFGAVIQKKVINIFHYALKQDGFLFLGNSETIGEFTDMFEVLDKKWKLFSRKGVTLSNVSIQNYIPPLFGKLKAKENRMENQKHSKTEYRNLIDEILIEDYAPPCVIINSELEILYVYGSTGKFLEPAKGKASMNLTKMVRDGMKKELATGVRKVLSGNTEVRYDGLKVKNNGGSILVNLIIQPLKKAEALKGLIMVLFEEIGNITLITDTGNKEEPATDKDKKIADLERDLQTRDDYLQSTVEEMETSNEELKSSNEELQSANEELQSTNEELETSREELQSVNEELLTVNTELQKKIEELSRVSNDLNNLLAGSGIGTIFVNQNLKIQRFTPAATQIINLINTDVGRPLGDLVMRFENYTTLEEDVIKVFGNLVPIETQVQMKNGSWYLMRIQPYRTLENVIEGAVLTFVDISEQQQIRAKLKESEEKLRLIAEGK